VLLVPATERLQIDGANISEAALQQRSDEMTADESAGAGDEDAPALIKLHGGSV
jgi:hypothetical protein